MENFMLSVFYQIKKKKKKLGKLKKDTEENSCI